MKGMAKCSYAVPGTKSIGCDQEADPRRTDWLCYYHGKIADGLIDPDGHGAFMATQRGPRKPKAVA